MGGYPMVPLKKITVEVLKELGACGERENFGRIFPDGVVPTFKVADEHYMDLNWGWAGDVLLDPAGSSEFFDRSAESREKFRVTVMDVETKWYYKDFDKYSRMITRAKRRHRRFQARLFVELFRKYPRLVEDRSFDPSATVERLRELVRTATSPVYHDAYATLDAMTREVQALDDWMSHGGRKPKEWVTPRSQTQLRPKVPALAA